MTVTAAVRRAAQLSPNGDAVRMAGHTESWGAFAARVARMAGGLVSSGLQSGDRVAVLSQNSPEFFTLQYAVLWAGGVLVPLNFRLAPRELGDIMRLAEPRLVFASPAFASTAQELATHSTSGRHGVLSHGDAEFERLQAAAPLPDASGEAPGGLAGLYFTGGTTGRPKGVMIHHDALVTQALEMLRMLETPAGSAALHAMPLFHMAGAGVCHGVTFAGATHSFISQFDPRTCLDRIAGDRITHLCLVPTMVAALLDAAATSGRMDVLRQLRMIAYGAAPMPPTLLDALSREVPSTRLRQFYGMTELTGASVSLAPEDHLPDPAHPSRRYSAGRVLPSMELEIRDPQGDSCPPGEPGEVHLRGPLVMGGYWRDSDATTSAMRPGGWLATGDVGVLDAEGYVTILDRSKDMIITGGENVYSVEVEAALASHPDVAACAVIGVPDDRWGERVHAIVVLRAAKDDALLAATLLEHCRERLAGFKCPRTWSFRSAPLPLSGMGKVQKNALRAEVLAADKG